MRYNKFIMKSVMGAILGISIATIAIAPALAATGVILHNGGLGQTAGDTKNFGVAVCNGGTKAVTQSVLVSVSANEATADIASASSIAAHKCEYTTVAYAAFNMQAGQSYQVSVTIDPKHTIISNTDNQASYNITVPAGQTAQTNVAANGSANANAEAGNVFASIFQWLAHFFTGH